MNSTPKVSVIIPTHNHAHFLSECLASVKSQTYSDYEVIIVNNGSTDNTEEVIKKLSWNKVRYHYQKDTGSVAGPRNTGIKLAYGKYVAFLDSDDMWYENKLEKIMAILNKDPSIDIISHDLYLVKEGKKKTILRTGPLKKNMFEFILIKNPLLGSATVVKRDVMLKIGSFDPSTEFIHAEDSDAWLKIAYLEKRFFFLNEPLGEYHVHSSNLSNDFKQVLLNERNVIEKHFKNYKSSIPCRKYFLYSWRLSLIYSNMGIQFIFRKNLKDGFANLARAFFLNPFCLFSKLFSILKNKLFS